MCLDFLTQFNGFVPEFSMKFSFQERCGFNKSLEKASVDPTTDNLMIFLPFPRSKASSASKSPLEALPTYVVRVPAKAYGSHIRATKKYKRVYFKLITNFLHQMC